MRVDRPTQERESAFYRGLWGALGDYAYLRNLSTNQKVAGSSPAERALKYPANVVYLALEIDVKVGLYHLFYHLSFSKRLRRVPARAT